MATWNIFTIFATSNNKIRSMENNKILKLSQTQQEVLKKIARRSKMDCWFDINENGEIRDLENDGKIISPRKACRELLEGATVFDLKDLDKYEVYSLLNLALKL